MIFWLKNILHFYFLIFRMKMLMKVFNIFQLIEKTCVSPTHTLEQHLMWDDIAILARYLLMLSFNNSLDGMYLSIPLHIFLCWYSILAILTIKFWCEFMALYYNLYLSFLVTSHLPYLFHIVTLLVSTGPLSLRASTHGLVINIIHSLCTCPQLHFSGKTTCPSLI